MKLTNEQRDWLSKFDNSYNNRRKAQRGYREDSFRAVKYELDEETLPFVVETTPEHTFNNLPKGILDVMKPSERINTIYTTSDYYALPQLWYTGNWEDLLNNQIDRERGLSDDDDTGIAGIVKKNGLFKVSSFHDSTRVSIGTYITLEQAKEALISYNKKLGRGYGV
jgi:hypothetical protein